VAADGEDAEEDAADHHGDGGLAQHRGEAFDTLMGGVEPRDDLLGAVENALGRFDGGFDVIERAGSRRHGDSSFVDFRFVDGDAAGDPLESRAHVETVIL
jgi:hypothetical protein